MGASAVARSCRDAHLEAEIEKKVEDESVAMALAMSVLPTPGGPISKIPFGGLTLSFWYL